MAPKTTTDVIERDPGQQSVSNAVTELLLRYQRGEFLPKVRDPLAEILETTRPAPSTATTRCEHAST